MALENPDNLAVMDIVEFTYPTSMEHLSKHTVLRNNATVMMRRNNEADDDLAVTPSTPHLQVDGRHDACMRTQVDIEETHNDDDGDHNDDDDDVHHLETIARLQRTVAAMGLVIQNGYSANPPVE
eukprot:314518-Heterocapsa_arctica.AAC.1